VGERLVDGMPVAEFGFRGTPLRRKLVDAILAGEKTSTSGLLLEYELAGDPIASAGERFVVLGLDDEPVAVIETTEVRVIPMREVDLQFAVDEGEGFESVAAWREAHERFWTSPAFVESVGRPVRLDDETAVVAERFRLVRRL
jgi:uncharacterized protein YhfF